MTPGRGVAYNARMANKTPKKRDGSPKIMVRCSQAFIDRFDNAIAKAEAAPIAGLGAVSRSQVLRRLIAEYTARVDLDTAPAAYPGSVAERPGHPDAREPPWVQRKPAKPARKKPARKRAATSKVATKKRRK